MKERPSRGGEAHSSVTIVDGVKVAPDGRHSAWVKFRKGAPPMEQSELDQMFRRFGTIAQIRLFAEFAFVDYDSSDHATRAVEFFREQGQLQRHQLAEVNFGNNNSKGSPKLAPRSPKLAPRDKGRPKASGLPTTTRDERKDQREFKHDNTAAASGGADDGGGGGKRAAVEHYEDVGEGVLANVTSIHATLNAKVRDVSSTLNDLSIDWQGDLLMNAQRVTVSFYRLWGSLNLSKHVAQAASPIQLSERMVIEPPALSALASLLSDESNYCLFLVIPSMNNDDAVNSAVFQRQMVQYMLQENEAYVAALPGAPIYLLPPCTFVNEVLDALFPQLTSSLDDYLTAFALRPDVK